MHLRDGSAEQGSHRGRGVAWVVLGNRGLRGDNDGRYLCLG